MEIQEQKQLADNLLNKLQFHPDVVLAGGAPRDWTVGMEAKDLDIFLGGVENIDVPNLAKEVQAAIGHELKEITTKEYEDSPFVGFECEIEGQLVQFLFHKNRTEQVIAEFPFNCSRISYKDGVFTKHKTFFYFEDYNIIIEGNSTSNLAPYPYYDRMFEKFPRHKIVTNLKDALKKIGGAPLNRGYGAIGVPPGVQVDF